MANQTVNERRSQMFLTFGAEDIERLRRFGEPRTYEAGTPLIKAGDVAPGIIVVLSGKAEVSQNAFGEREHIVTHGPGQFSGELAQLSSHPSLVDVVAIEPVKGLLIRSERLRDLLVQEAELGERVMRALILRRVGLLESGGGGPLIIGSANNADVLRLQEFLTRNGQPHQALDPDADPCAASLIARFEIDTHHLPVVLCPNGKILRNPTDGELARCIGMVRAIDTEKIYDVAIVGAGPAGLAAAVYAGSEGLSAIVLDSHAFGGQAGASMRIENYLGFPTGITGMALMARAYNQAQKFGVQLMIPDPAGRLAEQTDAKGRFYKLKVGQDETLHARTVVVASGARYRRLDLPNVSQFERSAIHYWASPVEARLCADNEIALVGGGNSAGQAAVFLARHAKKVWILIRGANIADQMSQYLVERIGAQPNIEVVTRSEISQLNGRAGQLDNVRWRHRDTGVETVRPVNHLFLFIGADPNTAWLDGSDIETDEKGFVCTGLSCGAPNQPFETNRAGVFAIGDVRSGSVKRVAAAVGEGAQVVAAIHAYFARCASPATS